MVSHHDLSHGGEGRVAFRSIPGVGVRSASMTETREARCLVSPVGSFPQQARQSVSYEEDPYRLDDPSIFDPAEPSCSSPRPSNRRSDRLKGVVDFFLAPLRFMGRVKGPLAVVATAGVAVLVVGSLIRLLSAGAPPPSPTSSSPSASGVQLAPLASDPDSLVFLILGVDPMVDRGRSDTLLLINLMLTKKKVHILSIPRDMYTKIERPDGVIYDKVNHSYRFGGVELTKRSIENELGIKIHHHGVVEYDLFRKVVNLMGGIPLKVDRRLFYIDKAGGLKVDLQPGDQVLNGDHALQYVRFRHDALGDFGRIQRQQKFVGAALTKLKDPKMIAYLSMKLPSLLAYVTTDVSTQEAMSLLWKIKDITPKDIQMMVVPGDGKMMNTPIHRNRLWFFLPDRPALEEAKSRWFFNPDAVQDPPQSGGHNKKHGSKHPSEPPSPSSSHGQAPAVSPAAISTPHPFASSPRRGHDSRGSRRDGSSPSPVPPAPKSASPAGVPPVPSFTPGSSAPTGFGPQGVPGGSSNPPSPHSSLSPAAVQEETDPTSGPGHSWTSTLGIESYEPLVLGHPEIDSQDEAPTEPTVMDWERARAEASEASAVR